MFVNVLIRTSLLYIFLFYLYWTCVNMYVKPLPSALKPKNSCFQCNHQFNGHCQSDIISLNTEMLQASRLKRIESTVYFLYCRSQCYGCITLIKFIMLTLLKHYLFTCYMHYIKLHTLQ